MENEIPRANQIDQNIPAEVAIRNAIAEVEKLGAHPVLTNIVVQLDMARCGLSRWYDNGAAGAYPAAPTVDDATTHNQESVK
jgi:hypothetical protein